MPLSVWNKPSETILFAIDERTIVNAPLPLSTSSGLTFSVISGSLPAGLRLENSSIVGTPFEVPRDTESRFVIRASDGVSISDRTFRIVVRGPDEPSWVTEEGALPVGTSDAFYILDNSFIDFQLEATDFDTTAGQTLRYSIQDGDGELPPGLILLPSGRITGFTQPALAIKESDGPGWYDTGVYDTVAYDFGYRPDNGYDSFIYDSVFFDLAIPSQTLKKLNRNYEFRCTVHDGDTAVKRTFRIFVVGDDYFRADNTVESAGTGTFTVDGTYVRAPIWVTPSALGTKRANNYLTFKLDIYEGIGLEGAVTYELLTTNTDGSNTPSVLPPGMQFDPFTAEVFGVVPYQPAVTKNYKFTIRSTRFSINNESNYSDRTFTVTLLGDIDSVMSWNTGSNLGTIAANRISNLFVNATSTVPDAVLTYTITSGSLPNGLTLNPNGEIVGKVLQFATGSELGLTTFDNNLFTLDGLTTSVDREYEFTISVRDQYFYSSIQRKFVLNIETPNDRLYSNIYVRPLMKEDDREIFRTFINDSTIFDPTLIYRSNDASFGVQKKLSMLIYAGIETKSAGAFIGAMGLNHKKKTFKFGSILKGVAKKEGTNTVVYEVVYVTMVDPLEKGEHHLDLELAAIPRDVNPITVDVSNKIWVDPSKTSVMQELEPFLPRPNEIITVDQTAYNAGNNTAPKRYPASVENWRSRISEVGLTERNFLPLWMRTAQPGSKQELGYIKAVPLCYCKPNGADDIILNIKNSGFNFNQLNFTVDRYLIDSVEGYSQDKYLVFKNEKVTIT